VVGGFMLVAERLAPLRREVESKVRRVVRNLSIGGVSLVLTPLLQAWLLQPVASWIVRERVGLLQGRTRRIAIVAMARRLLIALWRYVETGVLPEGVEIRAEAAPMA